MEGNGERVSSRPAASGMEWEGGGKGGWGAGPARPISLAPLFFPLTFRLADFQDVQVNRGCLAQAGRRRRVPRLGRVIKVVVLLVLGRERVGRLGRRVVGIADVVLCVLGVGKSGRGWVRLHCLFAGRTCQG